MKTIAPIILALTLAGCEKNYQEYYEYYMGYPDEAAERFYECELDMFNNFVKYEDKVPDSKKPNLSCKASKKAFFELQKDYVFDEDQMDKIDELPRRYVKHFITDDRLTLRTYRECHFKYMGAYKSGQKAAMDAVGKELKCASSKEPFNFFKRKKKYTRQDLYRIVF